MNLIRWNGNLPVAWKIEQLPEVDDVRPFRCERCHCTARIGSRIVLHGHGVRMRNVVVVPAINGRQPILGECWCRRYRCQECKAVHTVLPIGVLPRYLYSAFAMVSAFLLIAAQPIGEGLSNAEAYERQGMNPIRGWNMKSVEYRWRSIDRWTAQIREWWPFATNAQTLLVALLRRAGCPNLERMMAAAVRSHVRWGAAM